MCASRPRAPFNQVEFGFVTAKKTKLPASLARGRKRIDCVTDATGLRRGGRAFRELCGRGHLENRAFAEWENLAVEQRGAGEYRSCDRWRKSRAFQVSPRGFEKRLRGRLIWGA